MDIGKNWSEILEVLANAKRSNRFFSIATVDCDGNPHVTPIGHVFFRDDMTGYYFDAYSQAMPKNFEHNKRVCLMGVNSNTKFWLKSLFKGQFKSAPAVRLFGEVSEPRKATQEEIEKLQNAIRITSKLKGHKLLWSDLTRVRDIKFDAFSPATYPAMCDGLWK
ncbi:pyridoxamine 5'-phosphate oxidase family protein [Marinobacter sp. F4216]|uniref:pyridoxamine 5'-phosphate oxidase family protein n=1 Tax=Marinobacter sp. F4216 TaxID=2874281 RepID=UPI001CBB4B71|nr:pyridoxamine 5'-phosphate oxidase family protein [Marinobacter sp. F4216]MBZ2167431.1 pyridoxamine 5'-phosphate oxidase family protein [Marinobacter sp. F4216]